MGLFERYALGTASAQQLAAETGLEASRNRCILMNPIYNGWIRRHRGPNGTRRPAPWRASPPVSDELWARMEDVRRTKTQGGGPHRLGRVDLLECVCGRRIRSDGTFADGRHRKLHPSPCDAWGPQARLGDETWEAPVLAQVSGIELDDCVMVRGVAALGSAVRPVAIDRSRIERQMRELALEHVAGAISDETYLERMKQLRASLAAVEETAQEGIPAERAVDWPRTLAETWAAADVRKGCNGAPDRIRTCDLRLRRPTLYPLSYGRATQPQLELRSGGNDTPAGGGRDDAARRGGRSSFLSPPLAINRAGGAGPTRGRPILGPSVPSRAVCAAPLVRLG